MQVDPVALPLDLIDFALAVVLAAGLEGEQLGVPRERLGCCDYVSLLSCAQRGEQNATCEVSEACLPWHPIFCRMRLIIHLIIQTILLER